MNIELSRINDSNDVNISGKLTKLLTDMVRTQIKSRRRFKNELKVRKPLRIIV